MPLGKRMRNLAVLMNGSYKLVQQSSVVARSPTVIRVRSLRMCRRRHCVTISGNW